MCTSFPQTLFQKGKQSLLRNPFFDEMRAVIRILMEIEVIAAVCPQMRTWRYRKTRTVPDEPFSETRAVAWGIAEDKIGVHVIDVVKDDALAVEENVEYSGVGEIEGAHVQGVLDELIDILLKTIDRFRRGMGKTVEDVDTVHKHTVGDGDLEIFKIGFIARVMAQLMEKRRRRGSRQCLKRRGEIDVVVVAFVMEPFIDRKGLVFILCDMEFVVVD